MIHLVKYPTLNSSGDLEILSGVPPCFLAQRDKKLKATEINNCAVPTAQGTDVRFVDCVIKGKGPFDREPTDTISQAGWENQVK